MVTVPITLESNDDTIKVGNYEIINQNLEDGIKWIDAGDIEQAQQSWESALEESGGTS